MPYNKAEAQKKWEKWKQSEEDVLRKLGVNEDTILLLRKFDWEQFKEDRRFNEKQWTYEESFFVNASVSEENVSYIKLDQLLDNLEDINLLTCIKNADSVTKSIIILKINDYSTDDISIILHVSPNIIYKRIYKLRKNKYLNNIINFLEPILIVIILVVVTSYLIDNSYNPFLYFRF